MGAPTHNSTAVAEAKDTHAGNSALLNAGLETRHIRIDQILQGHIRIEIVARMMDARFGAALHGVCVVVLAASRCLKVARVHGRLLEAADEGSCVLTCDESRVDEHASMELHVFRQMHKASVQYRQKRCGHRGDWTLPQSHAMHRIQAETAG